MNPPQRPRELSSANVSGHDHQGDEGKQHSDRETSKTRHLRGLGRTALPKPPAVNCGCLPEPVKGKFASLMGFAPPLSGTRPTGGRFASGLRGRGHHMIWPVTGSDDRPFRLRVEQAFTQPGLPGTVIAGRFLQGSIDFGDELELVTHDTSGDVKRTSLTCESYSLLCEVDWDPSKGVLLGVTVQGIRPGGVVPGSVLQAADGTAGE